jgi:hypothetical protein
LTNLLFLQLQRMNKFARYWAKVNFIYTHTHTKRKIKNVCSYALKASGHQFYIQINLSSTSKYLIPKTSYFKFKISKNYQNQWLIGLPVPLDGTEVGPPFGNELRRLLGQLPSSNLAASIYCRWNNINTSSSNNLTRGLWLVLKLAITIRS